MRLIAGVFYPSRFQRQKTTRQSQAQMAAKTSLHATPEPTTSSPVLQLFLLIAPVSMAKWRIWFRYPELRTAITIFTIHLRKRPTVR